MKIYLEKVYSYRTKYVLFGSTVASLLGIIFLILVVNESILTDWKKGIILTLAETIFSFGIPALLLLVGLWGIRAWKNHTVRKLIISEAGVQYGDEIHLWNRIRCLSWYSGGLRGRRVPPTLYLNTKGFSFDKPLMTTDPLTVEEINLLLEVLKQEVLPHHPGLRIG